MGECVRVIVRCRPFNSREKSLNCGLIIQMTGKGHVSIKNPADKSPPKDFQFDQTYFMDSITESIYGDMGYPLVESVVQGYNATVFAYGQTGSGKSFTMQGIPDPPTQLGIIPRAFEHIFEAVRSTDGVKFLVHASYIEIYNEEIRDLLGKDPKQKLDLKEHPQKGVYVAGLSMHPVHDSIDCDKVMTRGFNNRSVGETLMNKDSSRSHSIFTVYVEMMEEIEGQEKIRAGKLNLVDLAGSERQGKTGATGDRLKEATKINLSLSALGNVISALVDGKSKHIPYRDSKLTRLLQDSLGGNTKTLMIAAISPASDNYDETLSTLRYANRAKNIKNKPKINEDPKDALLRQYKDEIDKLKAMVAGELGMDPSILAGFKPGEGGGGGGGPDPEEVERLVQQQLAEERQKIKEEYENKMAELQSSQEGKQQDKAKMEKDMAKMKKKYEKKLADAKTKVTKDVNQKVSLLPDGSTAEPDIDIEGRPSQLKGRGTKARASIFVQSESDFQEQIMAQLQELQGKHNLHLSDSFIQMVMDTISQKGLSLPEKLTAYNSLIFKRLQELQGNLVGGEEVENAEIKKKREKKQAHADKMMDEIEKQKQTDQLDLTQEDVAAFGSKQEELKAKNEILARAKDKMLSLEAEIGDLHSEFEFDRLDYLDSIRENDKQIKLMQQILEKIQPCIRKDCNYSNFDRVMKMAQWDEDRQTYRLPDLMLGGGGGGGQQGGMGMRGGGFGGRSPGGRGVGGGGVGPMPGIDQGYRGEDGEYSLGGFDDRYKQVLDTSDAHLVANQYMGQKRDVLGQYRHDPDRVIQQESAFPRMTPGAGSNISVSPSNSRTMMKPPRLEALGRGGGGGGGFR